MSVDTSASLRMPALAALALCLAVALGEGSATAAPRSTDPAQRIDSPDLSAIVPPYVRLQLARAEASDPNHPETGTDHVVTSCADDGSPGTLRSIIEDTVNTVSGDSINLTMLPMGCSRITLGTGNIHREIDVLQDTLHIHGPGAGALTIDGNGAQSIFFHFGHGTLGISGVTMSEGFYQGPYAYGGCIYSTANVLLLNSVLSDCTAESSSLAAARGGGAYTSGYLALFESVVQDSHAFSDVDNGRSRGGGIFTLGPLTLLYSTISNNTVDAISGNALGGGVYARQGAYIGASTISTNRAVAVGGLDFNSIGTATISNSTVSGNTGLGGGIGGVWTAVPTTIANSTVSFNVSDNPSQTAGIYAGNTLTLQSTIIADNRGANGQDDLNGTPGTIVAGGNNLITSWNLANVDVPANTRTSCPELDPLANNGGSTLTHKLRHDSPAIDQGDPGSLVWDQRGGLRVYPDNGIADIGAVEWQPTDQDDRILANGFDGVCDW